MACPSIGISTTPTFTRFIYYKLLTLVPVSAAITAMVRHGDSFLWPLLLIYSFGIGGLVLSIGLHECARCLNFECGHCGVPEELRREYLDMLGEKRRG